MAKQKTSYHINFSNKVGRCTTTPEKCPVSNSENHFDNIEAANSANEKILSEKYDKIASFKKAKQSLELSSSIYQHPKGYEFEQLMNNSKDDAEQLKHIKHFDYGDAGKDLILGKQSSKINKDIRNKISEHMDESGYIPVEYSVSVVEDKDKSYSVYLEDEDGLFVQASHKVSADDAYDKAQEMYELFDKEPR